MNIVLLPGDGIGPEITAVTKTLLQAVGSRHELDLTMEEAPMGGAAIAACGEPLPEETLRRCRAADAVLLAAIGDPQYGPGPTGAATRERPAGPTGRLEAVCQSAPGEGDPLPAGGQLPQT